MDRNWTRASRLLLMLLLTCLLLSCAVSPPPMEQALSIAMDRDQPTSRRLAAVPRVPAGQTDALYGLVWSSGHPMKLRAAAVDRLVAADAGAFWEQIDRRINWVDDWPMIRLLCERAERDRVERFISTAMNSWARPSTTVIDADRPERHTIAALSAGQSPERVMVQLCEASERHGEPTPLDVRRAAWAVLARVGDDAQQRRIIAGGSADDPLLGPLRVVAPAVDRLPATREEVLRMQTLMAASSERDWAERAAYRAASADGGRDAGIALRHLPAIDRASGYRSAQRAALLTELRTRLAGRTHYARGDNADEAYVEPRPERLEDHADRLSRADLLVLVMLDDAIGDPAVRAELFAQALADRADTTSEHGGVLGWGDDGKVLAAPFAPAMRRHDRIYYASDDCVVAMHAGLAHYHFHVQEPDNAAWAGPGGGDMDFAEALQANCVVFTSVDADTLNVDAYFPGNIVVDLGCIARPR